MPRYEILLPLVFNDGSPVPDELFAKTKDELILRFSGLTTSPPGSPVEGFWKSAGVLYCDELVVYRVTTRHDEDQFFAEYKKVLADRFKQREVWVERIEAKPL